MENQLENDEFEPKQAKVFVTLMLPMDVLEKVKQEAKDLGVDFRTLLTSVIVSTYE